MKLILALLLLVSATWAQCTGYASSTSMYVNRTKVPSTQSNFTVLVDQTTAALADTGHGGSVVNVTAGVPQDLVFCDVGDTALAHWEWESYDATNGHIRVWVLLATVNGAAAGSDTGFHANAGKAFVTTFQGGATGTAWDSNYTLVSHLPNGTTLTAANSVSGIGSGTITAATATTGQIGGGAAFVASNSAQIDFGAPNLSAYTALTASVWMKASAPVGVALAYWGGGAASTQVFIADQNGGSGHARAYVQTISAGTGVNGTTNICDGVWHQIVTVWDSSSTSLKLYVDGVQQGVTTTVLGATLGIGTGGGSHLLVGNYSGTLYYTGAADEVRVSKVAKSADWLQAEYNNQSSPSTFVTGTTAIVCTITTASLPNALIQAAYSQTLATVNCVSPTFSLTSGTFPSGTYPSGTFALSSGGVITGKSRMVESQTFTVHVVDTVNQPSSTAFTLTTALPSLPVADPVFSASPTYTAYAREVCENHVTDTLSDTVLQCGTAPGGPYNTYATPVVNTVLAGDYYFGASDLSVNSTCVNVPPSTPLYCRVVARNPYSLTNSTAGTASTPTLVTSLAGVASKPLTISSVGPVIRIADGFNGSHGMANLGNAAWHSGDTFYPSLRADGKYMTASEDCKGFGGTYTMGGNTCLLLWNADLLSGVNLGGYRAADYPLGGAARTGSMGMIEVRGEAYLTDGIFSAGAPFTGGGYCCQQFLRSRDSWAHSVSYRKNTGIAATEAAGVDISIPVAITAASVSGTTVTITTASGAANWPVGSQVATVGVTCTVQAVCANTSVTDTLTNGGADPMVATVTRSTATQMDFVLASSSGAAVTSVAGSYIMSTTFSGYMLFHWIQCPFGDYACQGINGMGGWVYAFVELARGGSLGTYYFLARIRVEELPKLTWASWQLYTGDHTANSGFLDANWDQSASKLTNAAAAPPFVSGPYDWRIGDKLGVTYQPGANIYWVCSTTDIYGNTLSVSGSCWTTPLPWVTPLKFAGSVLRDLQRWPYYFPGFINVVPGTYAQTTSAPFGGCATMSSAGTITTGSPTGANDMYTEWLRRFCFTETPAVPTVPRKWVGSGSRQYPVDNLDVLYRMVDQETGGGIKDTSPSGASPAAFAFPNVAGIDPVGMYNMGLVGQSMSNPVYNTPANVALTSPYSTSAAGAFTSLTCFGHEPGNAIQPIVSGEVVLRRNGGADFEIARSTTTNTWAVKVKGTVIGSVAIGDNVHSCVVVTRDASNVVNVYGMADIPAGDATSTLKLVPAATGTASGTIAGALTIGDATNAIHGRVSAVAWWRAALSKRQLLQLKRALVADFAARGVAL